MKKLITIMTLTLAVISAPIFADDCCTANAAGVKKKAVENRLAMKAGGGRAGIAGGYRIEYSFDKKPQLGTAILKISIFDSKNNKISDLAVTGDILMPSMPMAHRSGVKNFVLNKKGDYLAPFDVVMRGEWQILIDIKKGNAVLFQGVLDFEV
jgi:hypothetical protein